MKDAASGLKKRTAVIKKKTLSMQLFSCTNIWKVLWRFPRTEYTKVPEALKN